MKITLIGCGGWGERIARKLALMGYADRLVLVDEIQSRVAPLAGELDCAWTSDPFGYLGVTGTQASSVEGGHVIVATDPHSRLGLVRAILGGYGKPPVSLRIEKPLAMNVLDATRIAAMCAEHDTKLTTGFTLLHHPLYEAAFRWLDEQGATATHVNAVRVGRRPRHRCDALIDAGIHAASVAAHLECDATIEARFSDTGSMRMTFIDTLAHGGIAISECSGYIIAGGVQLPLDVFDALEADLSRWLDGTHRGTPTIAIDAQKIIARHLMEIAA